MSMSTVPICSWACRGKAVNYCHRLPDCEHKAQMDKAPAWLLELLYEAREYLNEPRGG